MKESVRARQTQGRKISVMKLPLRPNLAEGSSTEVLAALVALDESSNESTQQASTAIIGFVISYLAVMVFVVSGDAPKIPLLPLLLIPAPVLLLEMVQMVWAAAVVKRAHSAELMEEIIFRRLLVDEPDLVEHYRLGRLGTQATAKLTDISHIGEFGWGSRILPVIGMLPYVAFYGLTTGFVGYVMHTGYAWAGKITDLPERERSILMVTIASVCYGLLLVLFFVGVFAAYVLPFDRTKNFPSLQLEDPDEPPAQTPKARQQ